MEYREIGATGRKASVIGLGCEHIDGKPYAQVEATIKTALDCGVNLLDVFMPGREIRGQIARAIGSRRGDVMIQGHIGSTDVGQQYDISRDLPTVQRYFEDLLRLFGGYIDFGMMFFIDSDKDYQGVFDTGFADYVRRLKEKGDIGHIGFSSHHPETALKVINTGLPDMLMFSVNPAFDMLPSEEYILDRFEKELDSGLFKGIDPKRAELYKLCTQKQIGITVMKAFGSGKLLSPEHTPFAQPMTAAQCIHYALSRPAVASVLPGCQTPEEVRDVMRYFELDDTQRDYADVLAGMRNDFTGNCVYCSHCQPCSADIDIAAVNKYLDIARLDIKNVPPSIRSHYQNLPHGGSACMCCGSCEERCPFGVPVIENMKRAVELLG